ncbi:MAG TPA: hypothetical protein VIF62_29290 [Labilithrix sp.]|jgi:outer membrane biosynthesis protein TonB
MGSRIAVLFVTLAACGNGGAPAPTTPAQDKTASAGDAGATPAATDAGASGDKPFAGSASEATELIQAALDKNTDAVNECVKQFRYRKHLAHERIEVAVGIDQDGHVLGVTLPKRKPDAELSQCVQIAVKDAPFPKSHAGVITVTRSFEEMVR